MMKKIICSLLLLIFFTSSAHSAAKGQEYITLNIPKSIISRVIKEVLPVQVQPASGTLAGDITVVKVEQLQLGDQRIACNVFLAGRNLQLVTELAGHEIRMKVGNVDLDFQCNAVIRFDEASQTLYVRPVVAENQGSAVDQAADIGRTLMALLNGREFPVELDRLSPLVAQASNKTIFIDSHLADVRVTKGGLTLSLLPKVRTK